jgi:transposase
MTSLTDLREVVDVVIGVDTHVHTHSAAVVDAVTGGVFGEITVAARASGYAELVEFANNYPMMRAWAIEGTGGHGAGLSRHLLESSGVMGAGRRVGPSEAVRATQRREVGSP